MLVPFFVVGVGVAWYTGALAALVSGAGVGPALPLPLGAGRVTSPYGPRTHPVTGELNSFHTGVDIGCPEGTPVYSCTDGRVTSVSVSDLNGLAVFVTEPSGRRWCYLHLSQATVAIGDPVKRGQQVAFSGATGRVTGPHLHLQVYEAGTAPGTTSNATVDPVTLFPTGVVA